MSSWDGDDDLAAAAGRILGSRHPVAAVAVVTSSGSMVARHGVPEDAGFEIGSISKAFTGMLFCEAREQGLVSGSTTLGELLPLDGHGDISSVALQSLSVHRSGLPSLPPAMQPWRRTWRLWRHGENPYGDTLAELLEQVRGISVGRSRSAYSNLGFQLLGHAVAAASGLSYEALLRERFGAAYRVPATEADLVPTDILGTTAHGRPRAAWVGEALAPAGGIRATIGTMRGFTATVLAGTAPGMAALDPVESFQGIMRIGAGWITVTRAGRPVAWHNGGTGGFRTWIGVDREAGAGAVVLSATERSVDSVGFRLLKEFAARR